MNYDERGRALSFSLIHFYSQSVLGEQLRAITNAHALKTRCCVRDIVEDEEIERREWLRVLVIHSVARHGRVARTTACAEIYRARTV